MVHRDRVFLNGGLFTSLLKLSAMPAVALGFLVTDAALARLDARDRAPAGAQAGHGPLVIVISIRKQEVTVYGPHGKVTDSGVSTGQPGHETPTGVFSIIGKEVMHHSNLYGDAPMPYMQRITWSGVAMHAGQLPGYAASHGCVRLPYSFARSLFPITRMGTRVIVAMDDPVPHDFANPRMLSPLPSEAQLAGSQQPGAAQSPETTGAIRAAAMGTGPVEAVLGVSSAAAATSPRPRTREAVQRERAAQTEARAQAVAAAKAALTAAEAHQTAAAAAAAQANDRLQGERDIDARIASEITTAEQARSNAAAQIKALVATRSTVSMDISDVDIEKGADREDAIEANVEEFTREAEAAHARADAHAGAVPPLEKAVAEAHAALVTASASVKPAADAVKTAEAAVTEAAKLEAHRDLPISMLVSRKTGRVHVRQGFEDLFDAPVSIISPDRPLGTHVFTAMEAVDNGATLRWTVVTVNGAAEADEPTAHKSKRHKADEADAQSPQSPPEQPTPARAVERISFDPATLEKLQELVKPSSTLTISDLPISRETGKGTDFVLLTPRR